MIDRVTRQVQWSWLLASRPGFIVVIVVVPALVLVLTHWLPLRWHTRQSVHRVLEAVAGAAVVMWCVRFPELAWVVVLTIILVFRGELRRLLDQFSIGGPWREYRLYRMAVNEVVRAAEKLSARSTGALIAVEGDLSLNDYARTGVLIDGELSSEFLQTIFYPRSPLHDGAVIVKGGVIRAAGCLLPLARGDQADDRLGFRHRAGLGLSSVSDAVVVIVSEETASMSVASNGRIKRNLDTDQLRRELMAAAPVRRRADKQADLLRGSRPHLLTWRVRGPRP